MSRVWYGNLTNRLEENKQFCDEIKVGTGMTEYLYSDRHAYEVTEVTDQKHIKVRKYDTELVGEAYSNDWKLISNPENPEYELVKRGNYWYSVQTATLEDLEIVEQKRTEETMNLTLWFIHNGFDPEKIRKNGSQKKYHKWNVSFGVADYYYDYEF